MRPSPGWRARVGGICRLPRSRMPPSCQSCESTVHSDRNRRSSAVSIDGSTRRLSPNHRRPSRQNARAIGCLIYSCGDLTHSSYTSPPSKCWGANCGVIRLRSFVREPRCYARCGGCWRRRIFQPAGFAAGSRSSSLRQPTYRRCASGKTTIRRIWHARWQRSTRACVGSSVGSRRRIVPSLTKSLFLPDLLHCKGP